MTSPADDFVDDAKSSSDLCTEGARQRGLHGFETVSAVSSLEKIFIWKLLSENKNRSLVSSEKKQMKAVFMVAYERQTSFTIIKTKNIIIDFCELLMRSLWLDSASTNKSFNLYYFRFLAVKRQIQHQHHY